MNPVAAGFKGAFLFLSRQQRLRRWMETSPEAERLTARFIAGLTLEDALRVAMDLRSRGILISLDHLGENVRSQAEAIEARNDYLRAIARLREAQLPATVSMKMTSLGMDISEDLCRANTAALVQAARDARSVIECDMEDSSYTDRNLKIVQDMHSAYGSVRAVIQAYLYRSEADIDALNRSGVPVRLCKGAYSEPASVAFPAKADVDRNYVRLMKSLFDHGVNPAIATHDEAIVGQAIAHVRARNIRPDQFEFQMLYGVRRKLQAQILDRGFRLRLYVPYGTAWYPYFMRRLAERPANVLFLAKSLAAD